MDPNHWLSMRTIFGDPDLGLPPSTSGDADEEYMRGLVLMEQGNDNAALDAFRRADALGHAGAPRELAQSWMSVTGSALPEEWEPLLVRAYERGDGRAASWLGQKCIKESDRRLEYLHFADQSGDPEGSRALGLALQANGDLAAAEAAFRRSDERGSASGSLALGIFLRDHRRDTQGAEAAFRRSEQRGHPKGALNLIDIYLGIGDTASADKARERTLDLASRHSTVFEEMQDPAFVQYVRNTAGNTSATSTAGSGCALTLLPVLLLFALLAITAFK